VCVCVGDNNDSHIGDNDNDHDDYHGSGGDCGNDLDIIFFIKELN